MFNNNEELILHYIILIFEIHYQVEVTKHSLKHPESNISDFLPGMEDPGNQTGNGSPST